MLVLSRKRSEMIQIGEGIVIKIIHTGRKTVKIGIQAPTNVRVVRGELCGEHPVGSLAALVLERRNRLSEREIPLEAVSVAGGVSSV